MSFIIFDFIKKTSSRNIVTHFCLFNFGFQDANVHILQYFFELSPSMFLLLNYMQKNIANTLNTLE